MAERRTGSRWLWLGLAGLLLVARNATAQAQASLSLVVDAPRPQAVIASHDRRVFVSGRALRVPGLGERSGVDQKFDVIVAIDTSASTRAPAGSDVDEDGTIGRMRFSRSLPFLPLLVTLASDDPGDSILAAEVAAARTLLGQLEPETTHVGVVAFSGDDYADAPHARTIVPLTSNYAAVASALGELLEAGPSGMTDIPHAVEIATWELSPVEVEGEPGRASEPRDDAEKIVLLMTDGRPTLPIPNAPSENAQLALDAAFRAADHGVRLDTFAIGSDAIEDPATVEAMATATGGTFTPVRHPSDLIATFRGVSLARVDRLGLRNLTTGRPADDTHLGADGSFSGIVELAEGTNRLEVRVGSGEGLESHVVFEVQLAAAAGSQKLTGRLLGRKTRLLEDKLATLQAETAEQRERRLDQLRAQIEEVRAQRDLQKQIEVDLELDPGSEP